jgi:hypothetical protein
MPKYALYALRFHSYATDRVADLVVNSTCISDPRPSLSDVMLKIVVDANRDNPGYPIKAEWIFLDEPAVIPHWLDQFDKVGRTLQSEKARGLKVETVLSLDADETDLYLVVREE